MGRAYWKTGPCLDCGQTITKRVTGPSRMFCHDCAVARAIKAASEMAAHSGPAWDAWLLTNGPRGRPGASSRKV